MRRWWSLCAGILIIPQNVQICQRGQNVMEWINRTREQEEAMAAAIQRMIGENIFSPPPAFEEPTLTVQMWGTVAADDGGEPLTMGRLEQTVKLLKDMPPLMTDIWFVDQSMRYHQFISHFPEIAWSMGGVLLPGTGVRVHNWLSAMVTEGELVPEWCQRPGVWVHYNNGQIYRFEDAMKMGPRGWYELLQWQFDSWHGRAVRFVDSLYERSALLRNMETKLTINQAISRLQVLLRLPVEFGPRDINAPLFGAEAFAAALKASVEALARTLRYCENVEAEPSAWSWLGDF